MVIVLAVAASLIAGHGGRFHFRWKEYRLSCRRYRAKIRVLCLCVLSISRDISFPPNAKCKATSKYKKRRYR